MFNEDKEPVFAAPWEARAFAIVNQLAALEYFTWHEWTQYLSSEISATEKEAPGTVTYYENWVMAFEKLLAAKGLLEAQNIHEKIDELTVKQDGEHQQ